MPHPNKMPELILADEERAELEELSRSRVEAIRSVERARILLGYSRGETISGIASQMGTNRPKIQRTISKALSLGVHAALKDLPTRGRRARISEEAKSWVVSLACDKPVNLGYAQELWTMQLLAIHVRKHCKEAGHPALIRVSKGTIAKILKKNKLRPHKIRYYVERRDPEFEIKMIPVLHVYKEVEMLRAKGEADFVAISYDEKPGIQAIERTSADRSPVAGRYPSNTRDYEYIRHGTVSFMAGINLFSGEVYAQVVNRHRSREFIDFLKILDGTIPKEKTVRIILDNHSIHISKETRQYLKSVPGRFDFTFTPKHGSWLNLIECFFSKMARTLLRGIRVKSKEELKKRILLWVEEINQVPVPFRWTYTAEDTLVNM
jgi:transposase